MLQIDSLCWGNSVKSVLAALCLFSSVVAAAHASAPYAPPAGWPQRVDIPKLGVHSTIDPLRLDHLGQIDQTPPWNQVGWWDAGAKPGAPGTAQLYGHLDSFTGPAIFANLSRLVPGDRVQVDYRNSKPLTFRVMWSKSYSNGTLPMNWMIRATRLRGIALITCSGVFHGLNKGGYDHKLLVYARLVMPNGSLD
jgi:sortase A